MFSLDPNCILSRVQSGTSNMGQHIEVQRIATIQLKNLIAPISPHALSVGDDLRNRINSLLAKQAEHIERAIIVLHRQRVRAGARL